MHSGQESVIVSVSKSYLFVSLCQIKASMWDSARSI